MRLSLLIVAFETSIAKRSSTYRGPTPWPPHGLPWAIHWCDGETTRSTGAQGVHAHDVLAQRARTATYERSPLGRPALHRHGPCRTRSRNPRDCPDDDVVTRFSVHANAACSRRERTESFHGHSDSDQHQPVHEHQDGNDRNTRHHPCGHCKPAGIQQNSCTNISGRHGRSVCRFDGLPPHTTEPHSVAPV